MEIKKMSREIEIEEQDKSKNEPFLWVEDVDASFAVLNL